MTVFDLIVELSEFDRNKLVNIENWDGSTISSNFDCFSWRGSYSKPAALYSYDRDLYTVGEIIDNLEKVDGMSVTGYKGGDFTLSDSSFVYLVEDSDSAGDCAAVVQLEELEDYILMYVSANEY